MGIELRCSCILKVLLADSREVLGCDGVLLVPFALKGANPFMVVVYRVLDMERVWGWGGESSSCTMLGRNEGCAGGGPLRWRIEVG
jgi:hypothetical protein